MSAHRSEGDWRGTAALGALSALGVLVVLVRGATPEALALAGFWAATLGAPWLRGRWCAVGPVLAGLGPVLAALVAGAGTWSPGRSLAAALGLGIWGLVAACLGRAGAAWDRRAAGAGAALLWAALDPLSRVARGSAGFLLDALSPGRALEHLAGGALDLRDLLALSIPVAAAYPLARWRDLERAGTGPEEIGNARVRAVLLPAAVLSALACLWPLPLKVDVSGRHLHSPSPAVQQALGGVRSALLAQVFVGGPLDRAQRAELRDLRDALRQLEGLAVIPYSEEWRNPATEPASRTLAASAGLSPRASGAWLAMRWVNLRSTARVELGRGDGESTPNRLGAALGRLGQEAGAEVVALVGGADAHLAASLFGTRVQELDERSLLAAVVAAEADPDAPRPGVLLLSPTGPVSPDMHWLIDRWAMEGGALGLFTRRGGEHLGGLLGPWGVGIKEPLPQALGQVTRFEDVPMPGQSPIPNGSIQFEGPGGLVAGALEASGRAALLALQGSVPTGHPEPGPEGAPPPRPTSLGAMRIVVGSTGLLEANGALLPHLWGWLLDRADLVALAPPAPPEPPNRGVLAIALLVGLGGAGGWSARERAAEGAP